jgi:hypothetical protein
MLHQEKIWQSGLAKKESAQFPLLGLSQFLSIPFNLAQQIKTSKNTQ